MRRLNSYRLIMVLFSLVGLWGCSRAVQGTNVPFTTVAEDKEWQGIIDDQYKGATLDIVIATNAQSQAELLTLIHPRRKAAVGQQNMQTNALVGVFLGNKSGGGYGVSISKVMLWEDGLYLYARFATPKPHVFYEMGTHSPFTVISFERSHLPQQGALSVHLIDEATEQQVFTKDYQLP